MATIEQRTNAKGEKTFRTAALWAALTFSANALV